MQIFFSFFMKKRAFRLGAGVSESEFLAYLKQSCFWEKNDLIYPKIWVVVMKNGYQPPFYGI